VGTLVPSKHRNVQLPSLSLSLSICPSPARSLSLCLSCSLTLSLLLVLSVSVSVSLSLALSLSHSLCLSVSVSLPLALSLALALPNVFSFTGGPGSVSTVKEAASNGTPSLLVRGSGKAADLIADCVLARYSPDHELGQEASSRDENQKLLMEVLTQAGLCTGEGMGADDEYHVDIIKKYGTDQHNHFNLAGVQHKLSSVSKLKLDQVDVAKLCSELLQPHTPLLAIKGWIDDYILRASAMPRNFYGQTKKERKSFALAADLTADQCHMLSAFCDREGVY